MTKTPEFRVYDGTPFDKKIVVLPRTQAAEFVADTPWAAISISTDAASFPELRRINQIGLLRLDFWDVAAPTAEQVAVYDQMIFTPAQAAEVLDFVHDHWDRVGTFLIHCEAGRSRSPAVAAAVCHVMYGAGAEKPWFDQYKLNRYVYGLILSEHYGMPAAEMSAMSFMNHPVKAEQVFDEPWDVGSN
jgi:predicted protein tyrosine phosphatase